MIQQKHSINLIVSQMYNKTVEESMLQCKTLHLVIKRNNILS